jgi:DNA-binding MarR family transcriptional regulator
VQDTRNMDVLAAAFLDLVSFLNSPKRDGMLLREAGVDLDRALFPLLVRLGMRGPLCVADLAEQVGRDHTTVSRQLARLEELELVSRREDRSDRRLRASRLTAKGRRIFCAVTRTRRRLLAQALAGWSAADRKALADLNRRFADALIALAG